MCGRSCGLPHGSTFFCVRRLISISASQLMPYGKLLETDPGASILRERTVNVPALCTGRGASS